MFLPYSSDIYEEYPPWMGHLIFAVIILFSFYLCFNGGIPEGPDIRINTGLFYVPLSEQIFFLFFMCSFLFWWIFGKSVCSKIGNLTYAAIIGIPLGLYLLTLFISEDPMVWFFSWVISFIAGMYLVFWPSNTIDCVILMPPWRTFSAAGFWLVLYWLLLDALICILLEWYYAFFLHPAVFLIGVLTATILIRFRMVMIPRDEDSLWDALFHREIPTEAWKYSWTQRKTHEQQEKEKQELADEQLKRQPSLSSAEDGLSILCECGQVVVLKEGKTGRDACCPFCGKTIG